MNITFPDGSVKVFEQGSSALQIATSISPLTFLQRLSRHVVKHLA